MAVVKDEHSRMLTIDVDLNDVKPLTNFEVYEFVKMRMESKDKVRAQQTILYTTMRYFNEKSPCTCQAVDEIDSFVESMRKFNLNTSELLALINNCPTTQAELSVVSKTLELTISINLLLNHI